MNRLIELGGRYIELDLSRERDVRQIRLQFVQNFFKVIRYYFRINCPNWSSMDLEELRRVVVVYVVESHQGKNEEHRESMEELRRENKMLKDRLERKDNE